MIYRALAMASVLATCALGAPVHAQSSINVTGPYYATPSWDQKLPSALRFVVLSNWSNEAALDRETGLVWEIPARPAVTYTDAYITCLTSAVGGRSGWRLPTMEELSRTLISGSGRQAITDSPFQLWKSGSESGEGYWSTSSLVLSPDSRVVPVLMGDGTVQPFVGGADQSYTLGVWCVQSAAAGRVVP